MSGQTVILRNQATRELMCKLVWQAPDGAIANVQEARRTNEQNDKMWAMLSDIARAKPEGRSLPTHKWKALFMDAIGCKAEWVPSIDGESVVCTGYRSSKLKKAEMSDMIEQMYAFGAQHGVRWSEPQQEEAA